jgi:hypothetical protein
MMVLAGCITLALGSIAYGIYIGARLTERRHQADLIHQASIILGSRAIKKVGGTWEQP